jgi:SAM-dependent methyltransferase
MPLRKRQRINWENKNSPDVKKTPSNGEPSSGDGGPVELSSTANLSPSNGLTTTTTRTMKIHSNDKEQVSSSDDQGHRYGNFKNYYNFHPPANRIVNLKEILDHVVRQFQISRNGVVEKTSEVGQESETKPSRTKLASQCTEISSLSSFSSSSPSFVYCDVGCNEGDLTIEMSKAIRAGLANLHGAPISHLQVVGVDLDAELVQRATAKVVRTIQSKSQLASANSKKDDDNHENDSAVVSYEFRQADMTSLEQLEASIPSQVTLLSLFSTTMWLHIHAGDHGFREILNKLCAKTSHFVLVEPQPSKW